MKSRIYDNLTVLFAACQFMAAANVLMLVAFAGFEVQGALAAKGKPILPFLAVLACLTGLREIWGAYKKRDWKLATKGVGVLLAGLVLIDLWNSAGRLQGTEIVLLGLVGISALPILWSHGVAMIMKSRMGTG